MLVYPSLWHNGSRPHHISTPLPMLVIYQLVRLLVVFSLRFSCPLFPIPSLNSAQTETRVFTNRNSDFSLCSSASSSLSSVSLSTDTDSKNTGIPRSQPLSTLLCSLVFSLA